MSRAVHAVNEVLHVAWWSLFIVLALSALFVIVMNWSYVFINVRRHRAKTTQHYISSVPLIGGMLGACALVISPVGAMWRWCWIPFFADWGCVLILVHLAMFIVRVRLSP
jgi:hypothetical protein